jgi:hypothetical protein
MRDDREHRPGPLTAKHAKAAKNPLDGFGIFARFAVKEEGPKYGGVMPRVLVVDDEPALVELPQGFLTGKGYEVIAPHKPDEAGRGV